jgi:hypothetical protein
MKISHLIACICGLVLLTASCKTNVYTTKESKTEAAYVAFQSNNQLVNKTVSVTINGYHFDAKVTKSQAKSKSQLYVTIPGTKQVDIMYKGTLIYSKKVLLTDQQTKIIELP